MQLALTPEVLFPLGACAVVAAAVIAVVVMFVRSRSATTEDALPPTSADWTGEAATADPVPVERPVLAALPPRLTVAEAVAVRDADTAPLPVTSAAYVMAGPVEPITAPPAHAETADPVQPVMAAPAAPDAEPDPVVPAPPADAAPTGAATAAATVGLEPAPAAEPVGVAVPSRATSPATAAGSSPTVAAAVAHALRARAVANRAPVGHPVPSRTADARDRLLSVLLADPVRAVGAAEELATCRGQLGEVLTRLAASGLTTDQLARLSGFSVEQVTTLLERENA